MSDSLETDVYDYLLGQMEPERRARFEHTLRTNSTARSELKLQAEMLATFARDIAAPESLAADGQRRVLDALRAETSHAHPASHGGRVIGLRRLWPLAAMILIGLNFFDFRRPLAPWGGGPSNGSGERAGTLEPSVADGASGNAKPGEGKASAGVEGGKKAAGTATADAEKHARELEQLRASMADLQRVNAELRSANRTLLERIESRATADKVQDRWSTMELVDTASYAAGQRKGLAAIGRGILTEPGVVVPTESGGSAGSSNPAGETPYAWSVYDEKEHRGYINLYNLPTVPAEDVVQVWVRMSDTEGYQAVATVPIQKGSGSTQYTLPINAGTPTEVLVTLEPLYGPRTAPTGTVLVKGP